MSDNDLPPGLRRIKDEEWQHIPHHEDPGPPDHAQKEKYQKQLEHEKKYGHPAFSHKYDGD